MTLPTQLSVLRIVLTFVVMSLLHRGTPQSTIVAFTLFAVASLTDWLDGYIARRWKMTSDLGALLDPVADKVLVLGTFLTFVQIGMVPAWMVLVIALREFVITGVRMLAASRRVVLSAAKEGKHKTVSQMFTLVVLFAGLIAHRHPHWPFEPQASYWLLRLGNACLWMTMGFTLYSAWTFFSQHRTVLRRVVS